MLSFLFFVGLNAFVFVGAALVAGFGFRLRGPLAIVLASALVGWVYIVVGLELLGLLGQIRLLPSLILAAGALGIGLLIYWLRRGTAKSDDPPPLPSYAAPHADPVWIAEFAGWQRIARWAWLAVAAMTLWASLDMLASSLVSPVLPISDAPIYHLYFAVRWWQSGRLQLLATPFGDSAAPYFPANANVWFTWLILPWSSEVLAKVGQWPFLGLGMVAVYGLACELGVRRSSACLPAALWGTGTLPLINSGFADVDLVMTAWYLVSTWFLVRYARERRAGDLVCCAIAMGAALGTKYVAILFVPALLLSAVVIIWRNQPRWPHALLLILGVTIPAAFWYTRNAVLTGNPLYPLHQELFEFPLLTGWYRRETLLTSEYHIPVANWPALLVLLLRGFDPILLPIWISGFVAVLTAPSRSQRPVAFFVALAVLHVVLFWTSNPYQTQDRFLFIAFALLSVPSAVAIDRMPMLSVPFAVLLGLHLAVGPGGLVRSVETMIGLPLLTENLPPLLPAPLPVLPDSWAALSSRVTVGRFGLLAAAVLATVLGAVTFDRTRQRLRWAVAAALVVTAGIGFRAYCAWIPDKHAAFRFVPVSPQIGYTPGWLALEALSEHPRRVAYAGTNLPFYLFGSRLQNDVQYVNVDNHTDYLMHDYHKLFTARGEPLANRATPDWDRHNPDEAEWLSNLREKQIDLLFIGFVNRAGGTHNFFDSEGFPIERTWADENPQIFQPVHIDPRTRLYLVRF